MSRCHFCGTEISSGTIVGNASLCPLCGRPMKCCLNCRFYDMNAYHECREEIEEPVTYKDLANFCDLFVLNDGTDGSQAKSQEEARHKFLKLFNDEQ